jgi:UDP-N-acetylmuramoylalanine--D-glutamate ligase
MQELEGKSVLILGLGVSGRSAANFCAARAARVTAADERAAEALEGLAQLDARVEQVVGQPFPDAADFDLVVPSPGVPRARYAARARRIWGDVELLHRALPVPLVAITGTNGKSTTTLMIQAMLRAAGFRARAAGNLGEPCLDLVGQALDWAVIEVSSFQLETTESFRPRIAVILNLSPDHLDRHGSFESYCAAKARILAHQQPEDVAVLNWDDPRVRGLSAQGRGRVFPFSTKGALETGAFLDTDCIVLRREGEPPLRLSLNALRLPGAHNRENAVAALAASVAAGADPKLAISALASFSGLPHRCQEVGRVGGATFVNDSKATNPGAAIRSLESFAAPVVWIAGGRGKGLDFSELAETAVRRAHAAVLMGESAAILARALGGRLTAERVDSLEQAVERAAALAREGDVVLLAPACASQDQFRDYRERGERFAAAVSKLAAAKASA